MSRCVHGRVDGHMEMCNDISMDMCMGMSVAMCMEMCMDMCMNMCMLQTCIGVGWLEFKVARSLDAARVGPPVAATHSSTHVSHLHSLPPSQKTSALSVADFIRCMSQQIVQILQSCVRCVSRLFSDCWLFHARVVLRPKEAPTSATASMA